MVVDRASVEEVDRLFAALADATRRDILSRVLAEGASVSALARGYDMSFAAVQKHVSVLERAHLVVKERRGREHVVHGHAPALDAATRVLQTYEELWRGRIARIADLVAPESPPDLSSPHPTMITQEDSP